jgi:hypothetical protein
MALKMAIINAMRNGENGNGVAKWLMTWRKLA